MLISQLSKKTQIPIHMIRYYEKHGLIKGVRKKTANSTKYMYYDERNIEKIELIEESKSIGLSLPEIKELIDVWYNKRISNKRRIDILKKQEVTLTKKIDQLKEVQQRVSIFIGELEKFS